MTISLEELRVFVRNEDANKWISPDSIVGIDAEAVRRKNYDHGRLKGTQSDIEYLEESGDRLITSYYDIFINGGGVVDNITLQTARVWLIECYWSVSAAFPITVWVVGLNSGDLDVVLKRILGALTGKNPFVADLMNTLARELIQALFDDGREDLLNHVSRECLDFVRFIQEDYIQDGHRFSNTPFEVILKNQ